MSVITICFWILCGICCYSMDRNSLLLLSCNYKYCSTVCLVLQNTSNPFRSLVRRCMPHDNNTSPLFILLTHKFLLFWSQKVISTICMSIVKFYVLFFSPVYYSDCIGCWLPEPDQFLAYSTVFQYLLEARFFILSRTSDFTILDFVLTLLPQISQ